MIPKTLQDQLLQSLPSELATKLLEIQRYKNRTFIETFKRMVSLYIEVYELEKLYSFKMIPRNVNDKNSQVIEDWEL